MESYFVNTDACFILYDLDKHNKVYEYNSDKCNQQIPPNSTFKIALSLMAYDAKLINDQTIFKWDGRHRDFEMWNKDQTPKSWLTYSVVWVSQQLTPKLGLSRIRQYLAKFDYGNQVFKGSNVLQRGWISGNLRISGHEQLLFLIRMYNYQLPISKVSRDATYNNMYLESLADNWQLYGKTGSGYNNRIKSYPLNTYTDGWFVGYLTHGRQHYAFVTNISDTKPIIPVNLAGITAKKITKDILLKMIHSNQLADESKIK